MKVAVKKFPSKILLFGEYGILLGAQALVTPFHRFSGGFSDKQPSREELKLQHKFYSYLQTIEIHLRAFQFDFAAFQQEIKQGISFNSNIPQSYGVGSSGALVASVFDRYSKSKDNISLDDLKSVFSKMESFFHGESSGLDPLCSYTNESILVDGNLKKVEMDLELDQLSFFLVNTQQIGDTEPLVSLFLEKIKNQDYRKRFTNELIPVSNKCIQQIVGKNESNLFNLFLRLSELELELLPEMIPDEFKADWKKGIENKQFAFKLCGSGGGGFLLGISRNNDVLKNLFGENVIFL